MKPTLFDATVKAPLATVLIFSLVINLSLLAPSIFMLQVFDRVLTTRSIETLFVMAALAAATLLLMGVLEYLRSRSLGGIGVMLEQRHGPQLLRRMLQAGARETRAAPDAMRDLAVVRGFLAGPGVVALCDAPWTLVYLGLIYAFHPALGLLATACTIVLLLLAWLNEWLTREVIGALGDSARQGGRLVDTAVRHAEVITALGMQPAIAGRWQARGAISHRLQLELSRKSGAVNALSRVGRQFVQILMLGYGAYLVISGQATPGVMLAATIVLARALAPTEQLIGSWKSMVDARSAYARLRGLLDGAADAAVATELPRPRGELGVEAVTYALPDNQRLLLRGVSFRVEPGQVLALVGASGSGKTTLVRLLVGITQPSNGSVRLDGAELRSWDPERLGSWLGYVPQDVALFDGSIAENIARMGPVDSAAVLAAARQAGVHEMLLRLPEGYDTPVGDGGSRLSGGQRQRVALARALYGNPALVVMDEPDASLDAEGEQALLQTLRGLKERAVTVVIVTQRRGVLSAADSVIVMKDGLIERIASVEAPPARAAIVPVGA